MLCLHNKYIFITSYVYIINIYIYNISYVYVINIYIYVHYTYIIYMLYLYNAQVKFTNIQVMVIEYNIHCPAKFPV